MLKVWTNASLIMALNFHILRNIPTSKLKSQPMNWIVWDEKKAKICDREEYYMSELYIAEWKNSFSNLDLWCVEREGIKYLGCADKPIDCESGFTNWKPSSLLDKFAHFTEMSLDFVTLQLRLLGTWSWIMKFCLKYTF